MKRTLSSIGFIAALVWFVASIPAPAAADPSPGHVVDAAGIAARIDQKSGQADADLKVIQDFLGRPDVRQIATSAGLDINRATARAALLNDTERHDLAARATTVVDQVGGDSKVTMSVAALIIIILLVILIF
jgi:hypothetical protein